MFDFYITKNSSLNRPKQTMDWESILCTYHTIYFKAENHQTFFKDKIKILIIGDYWNLPDFNQNQINSNDFLYFIKTTRGSYYYFVIESDNIKIFTGFLGLCPIYYSAENGIASSSFLLLKDLKLNYSISERYILESFLFNHTFFNSTIYSEIKLLSSHSSLNISPSAIVEEKFWDVAELFVKDPLTIKESKKELVNLFIYTVNEYVPKNGATISFTSGFDGRTIVSAAHFLKKNIRTFSFGKKENDDVFIPQQNALELGLEYLHIDAEAKEYLQIEYGQNAVEIALQNGGFNGFLYPHFLLFAKKCSQNHRYLVTGYGGSEILRATHIFGAITPKALYQVITIEDRVQLKNALLANESLRFLSDGIVNRNIDNLIDDIMQFKMKLNKLNTLNKKIYYYILNDTVKKIFGVWQFSQLRYINVRSPFLDFNFVKRLFETEFAGVYNDFYTENPIKRFKGQLLYALILNKTSKVISKQKTGKGYKPRDLLTITGNLKLIYPFLTKRLLRGVKPVNLDNLSIVSGIKLYENGVNKSKHNELFDEEYISFEMKELNPSTPENVRDALLNYHSIKLFLN